MKTPKKMSLVRMPKKTKTADGCPMRFQLPVCLIEFSDKAIWVHTGTGATILRIQTDGHVLGYRTLSPSAPGPFCDIRVKDDISVNFPSKKEA